ncbi:MIR motif-containing protein [Pilobolus umbonatus]|nr:MIR motif-containing protein [Pilobolus umbonatus]
MCSDYCSSRRIGFEMVTCGSTIKLTSKANSHKLHSHGVTYGNGSGQQSVTGFSGNNDNNSYWTIEAKTGNICKRGQPVPCGAVIRLRHGNTKGYLHSHLHQSPLSQQQEVSCFDGGDSGDDWIVECAKSSDTHWLREQPIQFKHADTNTYLSSSSGIRFGHPIPGQLEVACSSTSSKNTHWIAQVKITDL